MKIIFWNIGKNPDMSEELKLLADHESPEILLLAEAAMSVANILLALNYKAVRYFYNQDPICTKILMFSKFYDSHVKPINSSVRYTVREIKVPLYPAFNLMSLHYQSKVNWDMIDQAAHSAKLNSIIVDFEKKMKSQKTLVVGDFNMNPFDFGMVQSTGLHSIMSKDVVRRKARTIDGDDYDFFYNPMWSFYGDFGKGLVNGTFYSSLSKPVNYFWNIYDQVLVRPEFIPYFDEARLEILSSLGTESSLLTKANSINKEISDHLPISLNIKPL